MLNVRRALLVSGRNVKRLCTSASKSPLTEAVMGSKVLEHIQPTENAVVVDMTFGVGGHSELILNSDPTVKVLALDRDPESHYKAQRLANKYPDRLIPLRGKFSDLPSLIEPLGYGKESVDAMLFECGSSVLQQQDKNRGFSHKLEGPLDMKMDGQDSMEGVTAFEVLHCANEIDLKNIFKVYGKLPSAKKIARAILYSRHTHSEVESTTKLKELLVTNCGLTNQEVISAFRALRYFVNDELNELSHGILLADWYLKVGGRLLTISEHQLEDAIIKNHLTGNSSANFTGVPAQLVSYMPPSDSTLEKKTSWSKINKHVLIPEGDQLLKKTQKLRAVVKL